MMNTFWNPQKSVVLTKLCVMVFLAVSVVMVVAGPWETSWFIRRYGHSTLFLTFGNGAGTAAFAVLLTLGYLSGAALITMFILMLMFLRNVGREEIFTRRNVWLLRRISWCCGGGALTTMLVGVLYARHFLAITCAAAFMMLVVRVIKNAFEQAILMKDELDLTV